MKYVYKCTNSECTELNKEVDIEKRMSDPAPDCQECGSTMDQVFKSGANFVLKGSGWTGSNVAGRG